MKIQSLREKLSRTKTTEGLLDVNSITDEDIEMMVLYDIDFNPNNMDYFPKDGIVTDETIGREIWMRMFLRDTLKTWINLKAN